MVDIKTQIEAQIAAQERPVLWVVPTPIGNLGDLSLRALAVLGQADLIAAEDTRQTRTLLQNLAIQVPELISNHDHNERDRAGQLIERLQSERLGLALVSDAGTPAISDPGYHLVKAAHGAGVTVVPLPGPTALTTLVSGAGLAPLPLLFVGFLPSKARARATVVQEWRRQTGSVVFFESATRLSDSLREIAAQMPEVQVAVGRELTKRYEEIKVGPVHDLVGWAESHDTLKGELVVMVELPAGEAGLDVEALREQLRTELARGESVKSLLAAFRDCGLSRNELYAMLMEEKNR